MLTSTITSRFDAWVVPRRYERTSVRRLEVHAVVLAGALPHLDPDAIAHLGRVHGDVLELHRRNLLREVRRAPDHADGVADMELAIGDLDDGDVRLPEVVRHRSDELLAHGHPPLVSCPSIVPRREEAALDSRRSASR